MKNILSLFLLVLFVVVIVCVPAFASPYTGESDDTLDESEVVVTPDSDDSDSSGGFWDKLWTKLGYFFDDLSIPFEVSKVFEGFADIWGAVPVVVRYTIIFGFSIACVFAILKMLF